MSTFEKQFGHLKKTDPVAYYDLKGSPCGTDSDIVEPEGCLLTIVALVIFIIIVSLT